MKSLLGLGVVLVAATALVVGNPAAAVATLGIGALALIVDAKDRERRRVDFSAFAPEGLETQLGWQAFEREVRRGRRYGHSVTLVRMAPCVGVSLDQAADAVREVLRSTDFCFTGAGAVHIVMPESGRLESQLAAQRLRQHTACRKLLCDVTIATFPDDALTTNGLVERTLAAVGSDDRALGSDDRPAG